MAKRIIEDILNSAGIAVNGTNPWDMKVNNDSLYGRVLSEGSLGLGESYMEGWWECERLDEFFYRLIQVGPEERIRGLKFLIHALCAVVRNKGRKRKAYEIGTKHYDAGNDLFSAMLDGRMVYTCGYWKEAACLDHAQEAKLDLVCRKLGIKQGDRVLDIGCGWGSFARYAAERYGARVTGVTVSKEQAELGRKLCKGLPVDIRLEDYRDIKGAFDRVVSLGMFEHVGYKNYPVYMKTVDKCLEKGGLFLLHTIGNTKTQYTTDRWMAKYIFPNSHLPSLRQISKAAERFIIEDIHNFGPDYDRTLMSWHRNFEDSWEGIKAKYDERFYRMWRYYLLMCAGLFRARSLQLWQIVFSKKGLPMEYTPVR